MDVIENINQVRISISHIIDTVYDTYKERFEEEYYLDMFINIMLLIAAKYRNEVCTKITENSIHWEEMLKSNKSKKNEFLIEKILKMTKKSL
jgi:hypothetical protein